MTNCTACNEPLEPQYPGDEGPYQFDNNLILGLFGGYGMFVEDPAYVDNGNAEALAGIGATYEANLCHECAHKLLRENPWLEAVVNSHRSHSHTVAHKEAHPDHYGWDYENKD